jgi:hypothetical protein
MPRFDARTKKLVDCYLVVQPQPEGSTVGIYAEHPIAESVIDYFGRRFTFVGVAPRYADGRYDLDALHTGEFIVEPGLLDQENHRPAEADHEVDGWDRPAHASPKEGKLFAWQFGVSILAALSMALILNILLVALRVT